MKKILLFFAIIALFTSCIPEIFKDDCELENTFELKIINSINESFSVYVDGSYEGKVSSNGSITITCEGDRTNTVSFKSGSKTRYTQQVYSSSCINQELTLYEYYY